MRGEGKEGREVWDMFHKHYTLRENGLCNPKI